MSDQLQTGDRVSWWEEFKWTKETPRTMTGTIVSGNGNSKYVGIKSDGTGSLGGTWVRRPSELTRIATPQETTL